MALKLQRPPKYNYEALIKGVRGLGKPLFYVLFFVLLVILVLTKFVIYLVPQKPPNLKRFAKFAAVGGIALTILVAIIYGAFLKIVYDIPTPESLTERRIDVSTKILDRNGELLYTIYKDKNRSLISKNEIPQHVKLATLAAEDSEFYNHDGYSIKGITRATVKFLETGELTGGSTITQQLVKNALLTPEKTLVRKIKEFILALGVEQKYSKDDILTMYLNEVNYGGVVYGIKEAANFYFDKDVGQLTIAEAALLAGLTKSPSKLSPFGDDPEIARARQQHVISLMQRHGFLTENQAQRAKNETLTFSENKIDIKAPHFVMYIKGILEDKYKDSLETMGLEIYTTLDLNIQRLVEGTIGTEIDKLAKLNVTNGAGIVISPKTGEILAMVGSRNYFDQAADGNVNVVLMERQPGSSIKPINYSYALSHGYTPSTIIDDAPVTYKIEGQEPYTPKNYDGKFRGRLTLRSALAESRNVPAVKVLASYGVDKMIEQGKKMGITTWNDKNRFGLSLTLGGGDVKLFDLAQAYQVIANSGTRENLAGIIKIVNQKGRIVYENECLTKSLDCGIKNVVDPKVAFQLTDILHDNSARAPAFGTHSTLVIPSHPEVAVKTGTSNDLRDNLTIGYNQDFLTAIWVGNNDNSPMSRVASGVTGASSIWNKIMTNLLAGKESVAWSRPDGIVRETVCTTTGKFEEWYIEGTEPKYPCMAGNVDQDKFPNRKSQLSF